MPWYDTLRGNRFQSWTIEVASGRTVRQGQRLDPFSTSMRDFKAVSTWLERLDSGQVLDGDESQHLVDLRFAGLVNPDRSLSRLGTDVLTRWKAEGADNDLEAHELIRCVAYVQAALAIKVESVSAMRDFWVEVRTVFEPVDLFAAPETLYLISYLRQAASGYSPWDEVRSGGRLTPDNPLPWLASQSDAARSANQEYADALGNLTKRVIDFSTRASGRVTFSVALELTVIPPEDVPAVLGQLGHANLIAQCYSALGWEAPATQEEQSSAGYQQITRRAAQRRSRPVSKDAPSPWVPEPAQQDDAEEKRLLRLLRAERANATHQRTTVACATWLEQRGFEVTEADYDLLAIGRHLTLLIEVKSVNDMNERRQTITAIGQLAYYRALSISGEIRASAIRVVLFDHKPHNPSVLQTLGSEEIVGAWIDADGDIHFSPALFVEGLDHDGGRDTRTSTGSELER